MTIDFDSKKLEEVLKPVARGLTWHHWKTYIGPVYYASVLFIRIKGLPSEFSLGGVKAFDPDVSVLKMYTLDTHRLAVLRQQPPEASHRV